MAILLLALLAAAALGARPCDVSPGNTLPFCNTSLSYADRVKDLVGRLTQSEKIGLFGNGASAVSRLNIPAYQWWSEALHGVAYCPGVNFGGSVPYATSFPQVIHTGATFNRSLFSAIGQTIGVEARIFNNQARAGLTFWTPNVNIFRDPRWGRGQETPGEDPYLTSEYTYQFVRGMQEGEDTKHLKVSACCKHYTAYDMESWGGKDRHNFNAVVSAQDMADSIMPPFQMCAQKAKGSSLMCSYNAVNGVPACADADIMTKTARQTWGFDGYITSDCGAVDDVINNHKYTNNADATCKAVLDAGMDIECGGYLPGHLNSAINDGAVSAATVNQALTNQFLVQFRLGMFDPVAQQPYMAYPPSMVNTAAAKQLALEAARQGVVLLKNEKQTLPLTAKSIALIGPNAAATSTLLGNYNGNPQTIISVQSGLSKYAAITYVQGCDVNCGTSDFTAAKNAASSHDATVIVIGLDGGQEGESHDRNSIALPGHQADLVSQVASASKGPVVVVVVTGGPVDISGAKADAHVGAIIWSGYSGQSGGQGIADVIFGTFNPGGRLPYTIYPSSYTSVSMLDMNFRPNTATNNPGRTYRFYTGTPVYAFGDGLSYTTFSYSSQSPRSLSVAKSAVETSVATAARARTFLRQDTAHLGDVVITVKNAGTVAGDDVVLAYITPPNPGQNGNPLKYLVGFERVFLKPGDSQTFTFPVTALDLSLLDTNGTRYAQAGIFKLTVGDVVTPIVVA